MLVGQAPPAEPSCLSRIDYDSEKQLRVQKQYVCVRGQTAWRLEARWPQS